MVRPRGPFRKRSPAAREQKRDGRESCATEFLGNTRLRASLRYDSPCDTCPFLLAGMPPVASNGGKTNSSVPPD